MHQLTQKLKDGSITIQQVPCPQLGDGMILIRSHYSLISAGTEGTTAKSARKNLLGKARERPEQVRQALEVLKKQGPLQTYRAVMKKLDAYSPLGYSVAGKVIDVGAGVTGFAVDDLVACGGAGYANHAEVVSVPMNLCVKLPVDADLKSASYNTLGAIALQGIRQADLRLGESCAVIGLGLIGQLTCQLLRASGIRVVGTDLSSPAVQTAADFSADLAIERTAPDIAQTINEFSGGHGLDAVIITAGTTSLDPVNFAGEISRPKGRVIIVGDVPTGFDRNPHYYRKELELMMSCSYGPGRYDPNYEEKGIDYPAGHVRWTENRNMEAFQRLIHSGALNLEPLTTHCFKFEDAPQAYDLVVKRSEPYLGIVLEYNTENEIAGKAIVSSPKAAGSVGIAFIGAGSYAQGNLLPNIPKNDAGISRKAVLTRSGTTSKRVAERFNFESCDSSENDILQNTSVNTLFVATRHDSHADYVLKGLKAEKNVFVEKPMAVTAEQVTQIDEAVSAANRLLMVGFNRRFAPDAAALKKRLGASRKSMIYRINAGLIPADSWIQDREVGAGRIIGEACHFIDFMTYICDAVPTRVYASVVADAQDLNDTVVINIEFADGSAGSVNYFANGSKLMDKEYFEVCCGGMSGVLRDFKKLEIYGRRVSRKRTVLPNKGQPAMVEAFIRAIKMGDPSPIPYDQLRAVTLASIAAEESIRQKAPIKIN